MPDNGNAKWVTIQDAAHLLDKSERTVWRWAKNGRLPINREVSPCVVDVSAQLAGTTDIVPVEAERLTPELSQLRADNEALREQVEGLQVDNEALTEQLTGLTEEVTRLISGANRLANDNERLTIDSDRLPELVEELRGERDYLRQAHAHTQQGRCGGDPGAVGDGHTAWWVQNLARGDGHSRTYSRGLVRPCSLALG